MKNHVLPLGCYSNFKMETWLITRLDISFSIQEKDEINM